ncbi:MAG: hypothetical protein M3M87_07325 [Thermoproteota archaeon]|nr:hypothetical protein [Thermoproteota archaeon]
MPINEKGKDIEFVKFINRVNDDLRVSFENSIKENLQTVKLKVMLADFTVIESNTFDPDRVLNYFFNKEKEVATLNNWKVVPVQSSKTDDLHRIFFQISTEIGNYYFYIYMGIQFHALLYYKPDKEIISISKRIRELEERNSNIKNEISKKGDQLIKQELENLGYKDTDNTKLFEELFTKQDLSKSLSEKAYEVESTFPEFNQNSQTIQSLKKDLENFTIELYQINPASIDSNKLMMGEEGIAFNIDFELIKNKKTHEKTSVINFEKINRPEISKIDQGFSPLINIFKQSS